MSPDSGRVRRWTRREFLRAAGVSLAGGVAIFTVQRPAQALTINPRSSWATDRSPKGPLAGEDVRFLIVHHSASQNGHTPSQVPAILRSFFDYHT
ncbi:MAG: twin-arginine translocation signal domain-containing protein, partial [Acidimicrobiia bacterium]